MRVFRFLAIAAVMVGMSGLQSCNRVEPEASVPAGDKVTTTISVSADAQTKAAADNDGNGAGIARCILQVRLGDKVYEQKTIEGNGLQFSTSIDLINGQEYEILAWIDGGDEYYSLDENGVVTRLQDVINDDAADAFYGTASLDLATASSTSVTITAKRPFAQLNLVSTDLKDGFYPSEVTVSFLAPKTFNLLNGNIGADEPFTATFAGQYGTHNTVAMAYVFADAAAPAVLGDITLSATFEGTAHRTLSNIPVQGNYRTNVTGKLFTTGSDITVDVVPGWGEPDNDVAAMVNGVAYASLEDAFAAVPTDGTKTEIVLGDDCELEGNDGLTVTAGQNIVLDLNGKNLSNLVNEDRASQVILNNGTLVIKDGAGTGKITNAVDETSHAGEWWGTNPNNYATNVITNTGVLIIDGGEIYETAAGSICYAIDNNSSALDAIVTINGGYIHNDTRTAIRQFCNSTTKENTINVNGGSIEGNYAGIWIQLPGSSGQAKKATLNVTGGTLKGEYAFYDYSFGDVFDAVNYSITGGTFDGYIYSYGVDSFISGGVFSEYPEYLAEGHDAIQLEDGTWKVVECDYTVSTAWDQTELNAAVSAAAAGTKIMILEPGTYTLPNLPNNITISGVEGVVFDCTTASLASIPNGATFENVTLQMGQTEYHGFQHAGPISYKNCVIRDYYKTYGKTSFEDCTFIQETYAYSLHAYGLDLELKNCKFYNLGKGMYVYQEGSTHYDVKISGCTFYPNYTGQPKAKAQIFVKNNLSGQNYDVSISDCTVEATGTPNFDDPDLTGGKGDLRLWNVEELAGATNATVTVTLDGELVYQGE